MPRNNDNLRILYAIKRDKKYCGTKINKLLITERTNFPKRGRDSLYKCQCDCGKTIILSLRKILYAGHCGCERKRCGFIKGVKFSKEHIAKKIVAQLGSKNHRWNPDRSAVLGRKKSRVFCKSMIRRLLFNKQGSQTYDILGYNSNELRRHIESTWEPWMNWNNYGVAYKEGEPRKWNIDHVKSIAKFHSEGITDIKVINALKNLRAMDARLNSVYGQQEQKGLFY